MAVSYKDVGKIVDTIMKYVPPDRVDALIRELGRIEGNKSYRDTIERIRKQREALHGE